jgi:hypothetical protein
MCWLEPPPIYRIFRLPSCMCTVIINGDYGFINLEVENTLFQCRLKRGLGAPRHIAIPSAHFLRGFLEKSGFQVEQHIANGCPTIQGSLKIKKHALRPNANRGDGFLKVQRDLGLSSSKGMDFIELTCIKK